jgi:hypothetical protein
VVELPVGDRAGVGAEPLGDFALQQAQVKPPPAQVVADGAKRAGIGLWKRLLSSQGDTAKGERNAVSVGTWVTP